MITPLISAGVPNDVSISGSGAGVPLAMAGGKNATAFAKLFQARLGLLEANAGKPIPQSLSAPGQAGLAIFPAEAQSGQPATAAVVFLPQAFPLPQLTVESSTGVSSTLPEAVEVESSGEEAVDPSVMQGSLASALPVLPALPQLSGLAPVVQAVEAGARGASPDGKPQAAGLAGARQILPEWMQSESAALQGGMPAVDTVASRPGDEAGVVVPTDVLRSASPHPLAIDRVIEQARGTLPGREAVAMQLPLRAQGWDSEFSQRVVWMMGRQSSLAELTLNPPNLGSVEVRLSLSGNEAGAHFFSPHQAVREAIETAMPRLREMLAENGLNLGQAQVSAESFSDRRHGESHAGTSGVSSPSRLADDQPIARIALGLVDLYV